MTSICTDVEESVYKMFLAMLKNRVLLLCPTPHLHRYKQKVAKLKCLTTRPQRIWEGPRVY
jgi:hypothetical protein